MTDHRLRRDQVIYAFARDGAPRLTIDPGDRVIFETLDSWSGRLQTEADIHRPPQDTPFANPATGPVHVHGAVPGDALAVHVESMVLHPPGYAKIAGSGGILGGEVRAPAFHFVGIEPGEHGDVLVFPLALGGLRLPARPMVGVIGTAPDGAAVSTLHPGDHGGNVDVLAFGPGATAYLPERVEGGLLALGDCHAGMGDGELSGAEVDVNTETTAVVELVKDIALERPRFETDGHWITYGHAPTLQQALRIATREMVSLLAHHLGVTREAALVLVSSAGDARPGQAADLPNLDATAYVVFPRPPGTSIGSLRDAPPGRSGS